MRLRIIEDIYANRKYNPRERKISFKDLNCLEIIRRLVKDKADATQEELQKSILQILREDHYQLVYFDGHVPEFTQYLYQLIINTVDIDPSTSAFSLFLCDLIYWCQEYFHLLNDEAQEASNC